MEQAPLSVKDLTAKLRGLGVGQGDLLMVHASLRALGPVEGGADGVIDALKAAVGTAGTVLMTLGARDDMGWVNDRPENERHDLLNDALPFNSVLTSSDPDVGVLAEVFRTRRGTLVSDHPEGRFGASGHLAASLLEHPPWDDYYGPGSPLERLVVAGGRVLRLGADPDTMTLLHYAEYLVPIPSKRRVRRHRLVTGRHGPEVRVVESLDDSDGIVDYPGEDYFGVILRDYLTAGRALEGPIGQAEAELIDAKDFVEFGVAWMAEHLSGC